VFGQHESCQQGKRQVSTAVQNVTLVHAVSASGLILDQCSFSVTVEWRRAPLSKHLFPDISRNICILWIGASVYLNGKTAPHWRVIPVSVGLSVHYQGVVAFESEADMELYQSLLSCIVNPLHLLMWHSSKPSTHRTPVPSAGTSTHFREKLELLVMMNHIAFLLCACARACVCGVTKGRNNTSKISDGHVSG